MPFKRPLARREIIGFSVIGACLVGLIVVGVLLLTGDDSGDGTRTTVTTTDITDPKNHVPGDDGVTPGSQNDIQAKPPGKAPKGPVAAPDFTVGVVEKGQLPAPVNAKTGKALEDGKLTVGELKGTPSVVTAVKSTSDFCGPEAHLLGRFPKVSTWADALLSRASVAEAEPAELEPQSRKLYAERAATASRK